MRTKVFDPGVAQFQAMQLFWRKGYAQTSMDELLKTLGISRSSFYNTFKDKRTLYTKVLGDFGQLSQLATAPLKNDVPIKDALMNFFDLSFIKHGTSPSHGCLLVNTILEQQAHDDELVHAASVLLNEVEAAIAQAIKQAMARDELSTQSDPDQLASLLMTVIKGLRVAGKEGKSPEQLRDLFERSLILLDA